jgi:hypothetical protein
VHTVLGLLGVLAFIVAIISLAAGITWLVVRISPPANGDAAKAPAKTS